MLLESFTTLILSIDPKHPPQDDDLVTTVEESALLQRKYDKYIDMVVVNDDFDVTFRKVVEALEALSHEHQWVPVNWIY